MKGDEDEISFGTSARRKRTSTSEDSAHRREQEAEADRQSALAKLKGRLRVKDAESPAHVEARGEQFSVVRRESLSPKRDSSAGRAGIFARGMRAKAFVERQQHASPPPPAHVTQGVFNEDDFFGQVLTHAKNAAQAKKSQQNSAKKVKTDAVAQKSEHAEHIVQQQHVPDSERMEVMVKRRQRQLEKIEDTNKRLARETLRLDKQLLDSVETLAAAFQREDMYDDDEIK